MSSLECFGNLYFPKKYSFYLIFQMYLHKDLYSYSFVVFIVSVFSLYSLSLFFAFSPFYLSVLSKDCLFYKLFLK